MPPLNLEFLDSNYIAPIINAFLAPVSRFLFLKTPIFLNLDSVNASMLHHTFSDFFVFFFYIRFWLFVLKL